MTIHSAHAICAVGHRSTVTTTGGPCVEPEFTNAKRNIRCTDYLRWPWNYCTMFSECDICVCSCVPERTQCPQRPPLTALNITEVCTSCAAGESGDGLTCTSCIPGNFSTVPPSNQCAQCSPGKYNSYTIRLNCLSCPVNSFSPAGSTTINSCICNTGWYGLAGGTCGRLCPDNSYHSGTSVCVPCPVNTVATAGSTAITSCVCNAGYNGLSGGLCTQCQPGTYPTEAIVISA